MLSIDRCEVHVWWVDESEVTPSLMARYRAMMSASELARYDRFLVERPKTQHTIARALIRSMLSRYADRAPDAWTFVDNDHGRPAIADRTGIPPIDFNLTHTDGVVAMIVALDREVGVDAEWAGRSIGGLDIAESYFSPSEVRDLFALEPARRMERFWHYWTLKESYIKARGKGLAIPLDQFSFHLSRDVPVTISFDPRLDDDASTWQFQQVRPTREHHMAVAVRRKREPDLRIVVRKVLPLTEAT